MPSAQVIDFGEDPYSNAMGGFAKNFLGALNKRTAEKRNDEIFSKIKEKYGPDASAETIFRDVLESEGLDQEYKRNKLDEIKDYAALSTKGRTTPYQNAMLEIRKDELNLRKDKAEKEAEGKGITPYQEKVLKNQEVRLAQDKRRLDQAAQKQEADLPQRIDRYTSGLLKDADTKLPAHDKADLNSFIHQLMTEDKLGVDEAFNRAYDYIETRREKVDNVKITPKPTSWIGSPNPKQVQENMEKAFLELEALYDEDGVESQKDLRSIAERAGWSSEDTTKMLQRLFQSKGKKLLGRKSGPQQSAQIPFQEQGRAAQVAGLDDILFGD